VIHIHTFNKCDCKTYKYISVVNIKVFDSAFYLYIEHINEFLNHRPNLFMNWWKFKTQKYPLPRQEIIGVWKIKYK